jgi:haloalkane dehalogenase
MIAMAYAVRYPKRIARIVLLNTAAFHLPKYMKLPPGIAAVRNSRLGAFSVRGLNSFARAAAMVGCKRNPMSAELRDAYCAPYDNWENRIATLRFVQDIPLSPKDPSYELVSQVEAGLVRFSQTPILLCWGMRDFVFNGQVLQEFEKRWPHAEVERFADCGHYVLEDAGQEAVNRISSFLDAHPLPASASHRPRRVAD